MLNVESQSVAEVTHRRGCRGQVSATYAENTGNGQRVFAKKGDDDKGGQAGNSASKKKLHGEGLVSEALTSASSERMKDASWVLDSGASDHMSNRRNWFITYEAFDSPTAVCIGDGGCIRAYGKGCINVTMFDGKC